MKHKRVLIGLGLLALLLVSSLLVASPCKADDVSATITGYVYNEAGIPLQNATVYVYPSEGSLSVTEGCVASPRDFFTTPICVVSSSGEVNGHLVTLTPVDRRSTGEDGFFAFLGVLPGQYAVVSTAPRRKQAGCYPTARIYPNQTWNVRIRMVPLSTNADCFFPQVKDFSIGF